MSDTQVSLVGSGNRQIEQESSEETTLSEVGPSMIISYIPTPY